MADHTKGNFEFISEKYPDVYEHLADAERNAKLDVISAGLSLRKALEVWCNILIEGIPDASSEMKLFDKLEILRANKKLPKAGYNDFDYIKVNGKKGRMSGYNVWRMFCNECSHSNKSTKDTPKAIYSNLIVALEIAYRCLAAMVPGNKGKTVKNKGYREYIIPIGDNYIVTPLDPADESKSGCLKEYITFNEKTKRYSVIREYRREMIEDELRAYEALYRAYSYMGIFNNVQISLLPEGDRWESNDLRFIVYTFANKPARMGNNFFQKYKPDMEQRLLICKKIALQLQGLHNVSEPIYHRNLSYDSIYICRLGNGSFEPSIIKFDYAKLAFSSNTVIEQVGEVISAGYLQIMKYRAPEVYKYFENKDAQVPDWKKADVFSLGVLAAEILMERTCENAPTREELLQAGAAEDIIDVIEKMTDEDPDKRPEIEELINALER